MKYSLVTQQNIAAIIYDDQGQPVAKAYRCPNREWEILNTEKQSIGRAKRKRDILRVYVAGKDNLNILPPPPNLCKECPLR